MRKDKTEKGDREKGGFCFGLSFKKRFPRGNF